MLKQLPVVTMQTEQLIHKKVMENAAPEINNIIESMAKELKVPLKRTR